MEGRFHCQINEKQFPSTQTSDNQFSLSKSYVKQLVTNVIYVGNKLI